MDWKDEVAQERREMREGEVEKSEQGKPERLSHPAADRMMCGLDNLGESPYA